LMMLQRIAAALGQTLEIKFLSPKESAAPKRTKRAVLEPVS
jgi:hypothetical protein